MATSKDGSVSLLAGFGVPGISNQITPPGTACRILPSFSPPGCHVYDSYLNCFRHRPEVRAKLLDAARRHEARRLAALHAENTFSSASAGNGTSSPSAAYTPSPHVSDAVAHLPAPCRCNLSAAQLFASSSDVPQPALPLSRCELHEVLLSLPPRWQNYPWQLSFDTARDGFSLSTLYRCMEAIEEQQRRTRTVAFGLFFVHAREDAPIYAAMTPTTPGASYTSSHAPAAAAGAAGAPTTPNTACSSVYTSPATTGNSKSFLAAHRSTSVRYGAARGTLPYSVVGCFTPEVPSLAHHAANIYYGSAESTVFRLDQLGSAAQRGEWMRQAFEDAAAAAEHDAAVEGERVNPALGKLQPPELKGSTARLASAHTASRQRGDGPLSDHATASRRSSPRAPGAAPQGKKAVKGMQGFAQMTDLAEQTRVPVPMPTHMTIEHLHQVAKEMAKNGEAMETTSFLPTVSGSNSSSSAHTPAPTPTATAAAAAGMAAVSPTSTQPNSPFHVSGVRRSLRTSSANGVVPRAPLLSKYGWAGRLDNRKFLVCNPHFFALGAGKNGAALYVDEALQFGTSSNWCETYSAPCLFGPRTHPTPSSSPVTSPSRAQPASSPTGVLAEGSGTFPGVQSTLPHREFSISRVVWFSVTEDKRTFRVMSGVGPETGVCEEDTRCRCGRVGRNGESAEAIDLNDPSTPVGLSYMHRCDLLPFTEQPY